jgi:hypothetical protein
MSSWTCSWSASSSVWCGFGVFAGFIFSLPIHEQGPSAARSTVCGTAPQPRRWPRLSSRLHCLIGCRASPCSAASLAREEKPPWSPQAREHGGRSSPNRKGLSFGMTEASIPALGGDGKHGQAERIGDLSLSGVPHHVHFQAQPPLSRLKTPSRAGSPRCSGRRTRSFGGLAGRRAFDKPPFPALLSRAGEHAPTLHERFFFHLHLPHLQVDERRTRLRSCSQVLWLWLVIDPWTRDCARAPSRSPHAKRGASRQPLPATHLSRFSVSQSSPVTA